MDHFAVQYTFNDESQAAWEGDADTPEDAKSAANYYFRKRLRNLTETATAPPGVGEYFCVVVNLSQAARTAAFT